MRENFSFVKGEECYVESMKEARWNVPGLFVFDSIYFRTWEIDREYLSGRAPVHTISGSRNVKWNSGRVARGFSNNGGNKALYKRQLQQYKEFGVNCFYTFSNSLIEKSDLADPECNEMLEAMVEIGHDGDGVILSSDTLSNYIRKQYPTLKQKVSVVKSDVERPEGRDAKWYNDLAERFDIVVFQPDDNFDPELLSQIEQKEKFELLVNEACVRDCSLRRNHYNDMAAVAKRGYRDFSVLNKYNEIGGVCGQFNFSHPDPAKRPQKTSCRMKLSEVQECYDMGYRYFKLQGRTNPIVLAYDIAYYLYEDGHTGKTIYNAMINAISERYS